MLHFFARVLFIIGFLLGVFLALLLSLLHQKSAKSSTTSLKSYLNGSFVDLYEIWFDKQNIRRYNVSMDSLRYGNTTKYLTESQYLFNRIKIICVILTRKVKNARAISETWATRCNGLTTINMEPTKKKKIPSRKTKDNASWTLLCKTLRDLPGLFHWVFVANDDTFAIMDNIRYLVASLDYSGNHYLGHAMVFWGTSYNSGQAGYVLSNGTLTAFKNHFKNSNSCVSEPTFWNLEDYYFGKTLRNLNISPSDTRDNFGLATFHGFNLQKLFFPGSTTMSNYYKSSVYPTRCCSVRSVTFQVAEADKMYMYNYLLQQLQVFRGGNLGNRQPTTPYPEEKVWKSFLLERGLTEINVSAETYYKLWVDVVNDPVSFARGFKRKHETDL